MISLTIKNYFDFKAGKTKPLKSGMLLIAALLFTGTLSYGEGLLSTFMAVIMNA